MEFDPEKHHRRSIRLKNYDYSQKGAYFVTMFTKNREMLFGAVVDGEMVLNDAGKVVQRIWEEIPEHYPGVEIDAFQIMPNHVHGIVVLKGVRAGLRACPDKSRLHSKTGQPQRVALTKKNAKSVLLQGEQKKLAAPTLFDVVYGFKSYTTKRYIDGVKEKGWLTFPGKLWHRNYFERIIRDESELNSIREYIHDNPSNWELDKENVENIFM